MGKTQETFVEVEANVVDDEIIEETTVDDSQEDVIESIDNIDVETMVTIVQEPVIIQKLQEIGDCFRYEAERAMSLEATEENKAEIKELRSKINKKFDLVDSKRKEVKNALYEPYTKFEDMFKKTVKKTHDEVESALKNKIDAIEEVQKREKKDKVMAYFIEACQAKNIDFVNFEDLGLTINLSVTEAKLKKSINAFLEKVESEIQLINSLEHKDEIFVEYKKNFSVSDAVNTVNARYKAIEEEKQRRERLEEQRRAEAETISRVDEVVEQEMFTAPAIVDEPAFEESPQETPTEEVPTEKANRKPYRIIFEYTTYNLDSIKQMKEIMEREGHYEQLG